MFCWHSFFNALTLLVGHTGRAGVVVCLERGAATATPSSLASVKSKMALLF